MSMKPRVMICI